MNEYMTRRLNMKNGLITKSEKQYKKIAAQSENKIQELKDEKPLRDKKAQWFADRRVEMVGICQCGCGCPSSKKEDKYFKHSACHIFPKAIFKSIMFQPLNFVERAFWGGCHSIMDDTSMDRWPGMADFEDIKLRFHMLAPLLTKEEKAHKFYSKLKSLVDGN